MDDGTRDALLRTMAAAITAMTENDMDRDAKLKQIGQNVHALRYFDIRGSDERRLQNETHIMSITILTLVSVIVLFMLAKMARKIYHMAAHGASANPKPAATAMHYAPLRQHAYGWA